jgi:hypothetical protein
MVPPPAIDFGTLCNELRALLEASPGNDARARADLERTLTNGYAQALTLEGERLKLERRIGQVASEVTVERRGAKTEELADLSQRLRQASSDLEHLRALLVAARRHTSAAA